MKTIFYGFVFLGSAFVFADQQCGIVKKVSSYPSHALYFSLTLPTGEVKTHQVHPRDAERVKPLLLTALGNQMIQACVRPDEMYIELTNRE